MQLKRISAFFAAIGMGFTLNAWALTADSSNPYNPIVDRNVFSLRPIPPPVAETNVTTITPPTKITLLGIVSYLGKNEVIFKTMASSKPGEAPKETTFNLGVKELQGDYEVVDIDHIAGTVRMKNHGIEQTLSLEKDGMKPAGGGGAPAPGVPGLPGVPGAPPVPTVPAAAGMHAPGGGSSVTTFGGNGAASVQRPLRVPTTTSGYSGQGQAQYPQQDQQPVSHEEQVIAIEAQRIINKDKVDRGELPQFPPTEITPK